MYTDEIKEHLEQYKKAEMFEEKMNHFLQIKQYTVDVPYYKVKNAILEEIADGIYLANIPYSSRAGIGTEEF